MGELINGRTPEKVRFNISECSRGYCLSECPYDSFDDCKEQILYDALVLIRHLEAERDAAIEALKITKHCSVCKWHYSNEGICIGAGECGRQKGLIGMRPEWEWAGAPKPPKSRRCCNRGPYPNL